MGQKSLKQQIDERLSKGMSKAEVFAELHGTSAQDRRIAQLIAAYPDPVLCERHKTLRRLVLALASVQLVVAVGYGLLVQQDGGALLRLWAGLAAVFVQGVLLWAFIRNSVGAYNAYIVLAMSQLSRPFLLWKSNPGVALAAVALSLGLMFFVRYVRLRLFPDATLLGVKKIRGRYAFLEESAAAEHLASPS